MNILLTGASGLIGSALLTRLLAADHTVQAVCRHAPALTHPALSWRSVDMSRMLDQADWLPLLSNVDCVINTVGIYAESTTQSFAALHTHAPKALFDAAARAGVQHVIQLSAQGADPQAATAYWRSKGEADAALMASDLDWIVVRPSLVYADQGASSQVLRQLAALPLLAVPGGAAVLQPIHLDDLADLLMRATEGKVSSRRIIAAAGPQTLSLADYLQALRNGMGMARALIWTVPDALCRLAVTLAPASSLLSADSLYMLRHAEPVDAKVTAGMLGRALRSPSTFAGPHLRGSAIAAAWYPLLLGVLAFIWFWTVWSSWQAHDIAVQLLADSGVPAGWQTPALYAGLGVDLLFGILSLSHPGRRLWQAQMVLILAYTVYISLTLPALWLHPFGPISKNLPILALLGMLAAATPRQDKAH